MLPATPDQEGARPSGCCAGLSSLSTARDPRGVTRIGTAPDAIPFPVRRFFTISDVPAGAVRGGHAHRNCQQVLVAVAGSLVVDVWDDRGHRSERLQPGDYLHLPAGTFSEQSQFSPEAVLLVLASHEYRPQEMVGAADFFASQSA